MAESISPTADARLTPALGCRHNNRAFLCRPPVLHLPVSPSSMHCASDCTNMLNAQVTALWVTHRLEELEWADTVSYMDNGRIQFSGTPREAMVYLKRLGAHV